MADIEQEGDSVSTTVSKDAGLGSIGHDHQSLDKTHNQEFGLEAQGATTDEANEESELSVVSGAAVPAGNKKKKKKNKRRRNKNRNRENFASDNETVSKVASNEALGQEEKPLIVTTYVCSSSELNHVRKLIDDNGNPMSLASSTVSSPVQESNESSSPIEQDNSTKDVTVVESQDSETKNETISNETEENDNLVDSVTAGPVPVEKVQSKSSVNVIFKVGAAVFENHSFTGPSQSLTSTDDPMSTEEKNEPSPVDDGPLEKFEQPTQPSLGELWMPTTDTSNEIEEEDKMETGEQENNLQEEEPQKNQNETLENFDTEEKETIDTEDLTQPTEEIPVGEETELCQSCSKESLEIPVNEGVEFPESPVELHEDINEENLLNNEISCDHLSQYKVLTVPNPSVENSVGFVIPPPLLHPHSLARIALLKRENPELVGFAQTAVDGIIQTAQQFVDSMEKKNENKLEDPEVTDQDSVLSQATDSPLKLSDTDDDKEELNDSSRRLNIVLSADKCVHANLSVSSSVSSIGSIQVFKLPKVPNPSVENQSGLQHLIVSPPHINASSFAHLVSKSTGEKKDASVESQQQLELPGQKKLNKKESNPIKMTTSQSASDIKTNVQSTLQETRELTGSCSESLSDETVSEKTLTFDSEKGEDVKTHGRFIEKTSRRPSACSKVSEQVQNWVIDPNVIEDALTESEIEDPEPKGRSTSLMKNLWNCFGKKKKSSTTMTEINVITEEEPSRPTERPRSRFKSFTRASLRRRRK